MRVGGAFVPTLVKVQIKATIACGELVVCTIKSDTITESIMLDTAEF